MPGIFCDMSDCTLSIREKCEYCGKSVCLRHIEYVKLRRAYMCTVCLREARIEQKNQAKTGGVMMIIGIIVVVIAFWAGIITTAGIIFGIVGFLLFWLGSGMAVTSESL